MADRPAKRAQDGGDAPAERYRAPALDRGLDILESLARQARGLTRAEIAKATGLGPSQIYRMLERLVARGYVARLDGGDHYALSMKLFLVATSHPPLRRLVAQAQPQMDAFARTTRQSCHLVCPEGGSAIVVAQSSPPDNWEFRVRIGARLDLFGTGSGQTLLAFQPPALLDQSLASWGIGDAPAALARIAPHLAEIRAAGYRAAPSAQLVGVTDLSVPLFGPDGAAVAALTCPHIGHPDDPEPESRTDALARLRDLGRMLSFT